MSLNNLPNEILLLIAYHLPPPCVVQLSYCCRRFYRCLASTLVHFRDKSQSLWVQHDRHPLTLLQLVRSAVSGDADSWFLTRLELWGCRSTWADWKALPQFYPSRADALFHEQDPGDWSHLKNSAFTDAELDQYRNILIHQLHMPPQQAQQLWGLANGCDIILRLLLVALAPRISELVVINTASPYHTNSSIYWRAFQFLRNVPSRDWPVGFRSLTSLKLNLSLRHPTYGHLRPPYFSDIAARDICNAFLLPNLQHLHLAGITLDLNHYNADDENLRHIPPRSLPLISLVLTDSRIFPWESYFLTEIVLKTRALRHIDVRGHRKSSIRSEREVFASRRTFLNVLATNHSSTLEYVKVSSEEMLDIDLISQFTSLKYAVLDVILAQYGTCVPRKHHRWHQFEQLLPPSLEFLHIVELDIRDKEIPKAMSALLSLAKKRGSASGRQPGPLTDVCFKFIPPVQTDDVYRRDPLASYHQYLFQHRDSEFIGAAEVRCLHLMTRFHRQWAHVFSRCKEYGVKVHTSFEQHLCPFPDRHIHDHNALQQPQLHTKPEWRLPSQ